MKLWSDSLMIGNKGMKQLGLDITMDDLPESVKETPSKFFKFFEKRFHKKAKKWKKKIYRIASLLQQDSLRMTKFLIHPKKENQSLLKLEQV